MLAGAGIIVRLEATAPATRAVDRLVATGPEPGAFPLPGLPPEVPRLLAVGIATVDLERAAGDLGGLVERLANDELLGARAARPAEPRVLVLEPATEGRLAATLARAGEGPAAVYLEVAAQRLDEVAGRLRERGATAVAGAGPLGRQLLVRAGPPWGPHLLLVASSGP